MLIPSLYATCLHTRSLRPVRVSNNQKLGGDSYSIFFINKRQEFLVSLYFPDTYMSVEDDHHDAAHVRQNDDSTGDSVD
jgi:hypothetical protein